MPPPPPPDYLHSGKSAAAAAAKHTTMSGPTSKEGEGQKDLIISRIFMARHSSLYPLCSGQYEAHESVSLSRAM